MQKQANNILVYIRKNPLPMIVVGIALLLTVGVVAYNQSNKSALQRKQLEAEAKLASQIEESKKANEKREAKLAAEKKAAQKKAEEKAAAEKAAAEAAAKKAAEEAAAAAAAAQAAAIASSSSISLSAGAPYPKEGTSYFKIPVSWTSGFNSEKGFKLVWNTTGSPTYPGSNPEYHEGGTSGSSYIKVEAGTYYIRVCQYLGDGTCGAYSNEVVVSVP